MSLKLNSSGGGSVTLQEPSTASNRTLTLPDNTGNLISSADSGTVSQAMLASGVAGTGPAFSAVNSVAQTGLTLSTYTKVAFNSEEFDTNNNYDSTTNYRFTPTVAGYYQINFAAQGSGSVNTTGCLATLYKNGASTNRFGSYYNGGGTAISNYLSTGSTVMYMNGTTDYLEVYIFISGSGTGGIASGTGNFSAALVRAA